MLPTNLHWSYILGIIIQQWVISNTGHLHQQIQGVIILLYYIIIIQSYILGIIIQ